MNNNAADALMMAASMMLAVLLISLVLYVRREMAKPVQKREEDKKIEEVEKFNRYYLAYDKKLLTGSEVLSILTESYDSAIALEPIVKSNNTLNTSKMRKEGSNVNEPLVNVEIRFKQDTKFEMQLTYDVAEFKNGTFVSRADNKITSIPAKFSQTIGEILGVKSNNADINELFIKRELSSPQEIKVDLNTPLSVFQKQHDNVIRITDEIDTFINLGGNRPAIVKRNNDIKENNNWIKMKYTTPAASFIRKSFTCLENEIEYNDEGYITKIVFEEI